MKFRAVSVRADCPWIIVCFVQDLLGSLVEFLNVAAADVILEQGNRALPYPFVE